MRILVYMINSFCLASGLELNWTKSNAFWKGAVGNPKPSWIELIDVTWADDDDVGKLLGSIFGMNMCAQDTDKFLKDKIVKKLQYWCGTKQVYVTGRGVIVNGVLLSTTYFFLSVWGRTKKGILSKILIGQLFWGSTMFRSRAKVARSQCCQQKDKEGINLVNPMNAGTALLTKWIIVACKPRQSNLQCMLGVRFHGPVDLRFLEGTGRSGQRCSPRSRAFTWAGSWRWRGAQFPLCTE